MTRTITASEAPGLVLKIYRVVPVEAAARGRWTEGPLVQAASEEDVRKTHPTGILVELMTDARRSRLRADGKMQRRVRKDENEAAERYHAARESFVAALSATEDGRKTS